MDTPKPTPEEMVQGIKEAMRLAREAQERADEALRLVTRLQEQLEEYRREHGSQS